MDSKYPLHQSMRRLLDLEQELIATAPWASSPPTYLARLPLEYQCRSKGRGRGGPCPPSFFS